MKQAHWTRRTHLFRADEYICSACGASCQKPTWSRFTSVILPKPWGAFAQMWISHGMFIVRILWYRAIVPIGE